MRISLAIVIVATLAWCGMGSCGRAESLEKRFSDTVQPFVRTYCVECHNALQSEGDLDLQSAGTLTDVVESFRHWVVVVDRIRAEEMPPADAVPQPTDAERSAVLEWLDAVRTTEAERMSGDPGVVLARRLSNAEYDNTIRDLTGFDLQPTKTFPVDPANEAGFDNSGESLRMSPALVGKYLDAARTVADHLVLTPSGIAFAPHPVMTDTDRDKYCVNRIIAFYRRQRIDYADYLFAIWKQQQGLLETDESGSENAGLSQRYLDSLCDLLGDESVTNGPIAVLRQMFATLPSVDSGGNAAVEAMAMARCREIRDWIVGLRRSLVPEVENLTTPEIHNGSQALVLWKNRQFASNRRRGTEGAWQRTDWKLPAVRGVNDSLVPPADAGERDEYRAGFERFCDQFPDAFFVSERARVYLDAASERERSGRYLSAGFHSQMGYYRDDQPLVDLMLTAEERDELDRLWLELDFITDAPMRQYTGFIWFDRTDSRFMRDAEFDRFRAEDKDCTSQANVRALADTYIGKARRVGGNDQAIEALQVYFDQMSATFRRLERLHLEAEPRQLNAMLEFAERAFRRPLVDEERDSLRQFYRHLREDEQLDHDAALRDVLVSVLMSPHFSYRVDLPGVGAEIEVLSSEKGIAAQPLTDIALASRLSYFLWSSMPDQELIDLAIAGRLQDEDVLRTQAKRMLVDPKVSGMATEFIGNWLDIRRFPEHAGVDRNRFPQFSDALRQAMFEEPIRFFVDLMKRDGSVLECLDADHTLVNRRLAEHYGARLEWVGKSPKAWQRWDAASQHGRGGWLPMAVFLTANSPGLRTSPVKRGNWLVQRVLGESIPAPPPTVPELPDDEADLGSLSLREMLARHRADTACASCHERIDSFGLVFEGYGPIGELRRTDLGGRVIDDSVEFPGGESGQGIEGLRQYIQATRQTDFTETLCRKWLVYALGRSLQLSDEPLIDQMLVNLESEDHRVGSIIETIVTSPVFRNQRRAARNESLSE